MRLGTGRAQFRHKEEWGMVGAPCKSSNIMVPEEGLEPSQGYPYRILSPARLPFHHSGTELLLITNR